jgi:hypothetical protein
MTLAIAGISLPDEPGVRQNRMELHHGQPDPEAFGASGMVVAVTLRKTADAIFVHAPVVQCRRQNAGIRKAHALKKKTILAEQALASHL